MKKIVKLAVTAMVFSALAGGSLFAKSVVITKGPASGPAASLPCVEISVSTDKDSKPVKPEKDDKDKDDKHDKRKDFKKNAMRGKMKGGSQKKMIIGKVDSVSRFDKTIRVIDADGKAVDILVSPFTSIYSADKKDLTLNDIRMNKWVKVAVYEGDTKVKNAARIEIEK